MARPNASTVFVYCRMIVNSNGVDRIPLVTVHDSSGVLYVWQCNASLSVVLIHVLQSSTSSSVVPTFNLAVPSSCTIILMLSVSLAFPPHRTLWMGSLQESKYGLSDDNDLFDQCCRLSKVLYHSISSPGLWLYLQIAQKATRAVYSEF